MKLEKLALALGLVGICWSPAAWSQDSAPSSPTSPPPQTEPGMPATPGRSAPEQASAPLQPPRNVGAEPATPESEALATRAAKSEMAGDPRSALTLAAQAVAADPRDPWAHYDKAMALAHLGNVDDALKSFTAAETRFAPGDPWARSVAIYGGAHVLATAGRCDEARRELLRYATFVRDRDPKSADMATSYAATCRPPAVPSTR